MARKWSQVNQKTRQRRYLRNSARARALSRLKMRHPDEFEELFAEEIAAGPILSSDRTLLVDAERDESVGSVHRLPKDSTPASATAWVPAVERLAA